jgi:hypothetical protein
MDPSRPPTEAADADTVLRRSLLVTSMYTEGDLARRLGRDSYSYRYVYRAFQPLLQRWADTADVSGPPETLDAAVARARDQGRDAIHLSFLPLHLMRRAVGVPNIGVPAWEFPDIPQHDTADWSRVAADLDLIFTHTNYSRDAFLRAGVRTPVQVVPVPVHPDYFEGPDWKPGGRVVLDFPCYVFPQPPDLPRQPRRWVANGTGHLPRRPGLRQLCKSAVGSLPGGMGRGLLRLARASRDGLWAARQSLRENDVRRMFPPLPQLELSGVVYTTILNPCDRRKNCSDLLSGFLLALRDCDDATLVVKLVASADWEAEALGEVLAAYREVGIRHRCRVAFVTAYLSHEQLLVLTAASTYYLNTSHAEGSCLPLQDFLAAGRPAVAPAHTGMADSLDGRCGFVIASHPEPARSPLEPDGGLTTRWHRLVWQSLHDELRASYDVARAAGSRYASLAAAGRDRMRGLASRAAVWPRLAAALHQAMGRRARRQAG